jgi:nucleoside-diphosphate-sugar epimerase
VATRWAPWYRRHDGPVQSHTRVPLRLYGPSERMKRALVTGASGFLGRHCLAPLLERGFEVHGISRHSVGEPEKVRWHRVDLHNPAHVTSLVQDVRPTHLVHCAWAVDPGVYQTSPGNLRWVSSSLTLATEFVASGGQRMVGVGTGLEYDWRYGYCSEAVTPLAPATLYATAKHALRCLLEAYALQVGLSQAWARLFFVYGPHEHPDRLVSSVIRKVLLDQRAETSHGRQVRDYLHIADAGEAVAALVDRATTGPVNVASGRPVSLQEIVHEIGRQTGREELLAVGALPERPGEAPFVVADVTRLSEEVGWRPRFSLPDGLRDTIAWWGEVLRRGGELPGKGAGLANRR